MLPPKGKRTRDPIPVIEQLTKSYRLRADADLSDVDLQMRAVAIHHDAMDYYCGGSGMRAFHRAWRKHYRQMATLAQSILNGRRCSTYFRWQGEIPKTEISRATTEG